MSMGDDFKKRLHDGNAPELDLSDKRVMEFRGEQYLDETRRRFDPVRGLVWLAILVGCAAFWGAVIWAVTR